jgi:hypothetical protein
MAAKRRRDFAIAPFSSRRTSPQSCDQRRPTERIVTHQQQSAESRQFGNGTGDRIV